MAFGTSPTKTGLQPTVDQLRRQLSHSNPKADEFTSLGGSQKGNGGNPCARKWGLRSKNRVTWGATDIVVRREPDGTRLLEPFFLCPGPLRMGGDVDDPHPQGGETTTISGLGFRFTNKAGIWLRMWRSYPRYKTP